MILPTPTTYALLGLLGIQSWSAYDLVAQSRRGLHFWPRSEAHLYAELKRLVKLGYADAERITVGRRISTHYTITTAGRDALAAWLRTPPSPPVLECEALLRVLFADQGSVEDLLATLRATHEQATAMLGNSLEMLREVLTTGGLFPERRHLGVPLADFYTSYLRLLIEWSERAAAEVATWSSTRDHRLTPAGRAALLEMLEGIEDVRRTGWTDPAPRAASL